MNRAEKARVKAEELAKFFHDTYEGLAPVFRYETRKESRVEWDELPKENKDLMLATCHMVLWYLEHRDGSNS